MAKATPVKANPPIRFKLFGDTKGAVRYQEVDKDGKDVPADKMRVGTLYFRKSQFEAVSSGDFPQFLSVQVEAEPS